MPLVFVDSSVLIDAVRGAPELKRRAMAALSDAAIEIASSDVVRLELLPKAAFNGRYAEAAFYSDFFDRAAAWANLTPELAALALSEGLEAGLDAADALHVAAAIMLGCDEVMTSEKPDKALHRVKSIRVRSLH